MIKTQIIKLLPEIILIIALCTMSGLYALLIWGKTVKPVSCAIIYQGIWIEDTKKIGDYWSVGYLKVKKQ